MQHQRLGPRTLGRQGMMQLSQLVTVLGGEVTLEAAGKLLRQCDGNLQRAVNAHYDKPAPHQPPRAAAKSQASPCSEAFSEHLQEWAFTGLSYSGGLCTRSYYAFVNFENHIVAPRFAQASLFLDPAYPAG